MSKEQIIAGIDIGSSKICTIVASVDEAGHPSVIGVSSVISKGIKKGTVVDIDEAVAAIAESLESAERMAGYAVSSAFVSTEDRQIVSSSSSGVVAVSHQGGEINKEDVGRVIEAAQAISLPSSRETLHILPLGFSVDSQKDIKDPIGMSGVRLEVETTIIHGPTTALRNLAKCVQQVGVDVEELVFSGIAASHTTLTDTEKELGTVLIDIGGGTSTVTIFRDGGIAYCSVLPIGGQNITNDLAIGLRTSLEDAEKLKIKLSELLTKDGEPLKKSEEIDISSLNLSIKTIPRKLLDDILKARLNEIFSLMALEIKKSGFSGKLPAGVVLCGGGALTYQAEKLAKASLKIPVRVGSPKGIDGLVEEVSYPPYAASLGLIRYGVDYAQDSGTNFRSAKQKFSSITGKVSGFIKSFLP
jgi:cell division protein FtsA